MRRIMLISTAWAALAALLLAMPARAAGPGLLVTRIIDRIPRNSQEVGELHEKSELACVRVPQDAPLLSEKFAEQVIYDVKVNRDGASEQQNLLFDWGRWPVIDYGTGMTDGDQKTLPVFTRGKILDVVTNTYISIQARVHRAAPDGAPYLHYLPMAGVGRYGNADTTTDFSKLQEVAVANVRGQGLFLKPTQAREAQALRTLVITIKGTRITPNDDPEKIDTTTTLELLFVRMRCEPPIDRQAGAVRLHAFGTTDGVTKLIHFKPYATPAGADDCTIKSTIRITEFSMAGQVPEKRAARSVRINTEQEFTIAALDDYTKKAGMTGDAFDNLTDILDAIIDGKLK